MSRSGRLLRAEAPRLDHGDRSDVWLSRHGSWAIVCSTRSRASGRLYHGLVLADRDASGVRDDDAVLVEAAHAARAGTKLVLELIAGMS